MDESYNSHKFGQTFYVCVSTSPFQWKALSNFADLNFQVFEQVGDKF